MIKVKHKLHFTRGDAGKRRIHANPKPQVPVGRIPRIPRLMALAIRYEHLVREGVVRDQSELARLANVGQPRMTQTMRLLSLASDKSLEIDDICNTLRISRSTFHRYVRM